MKSSSIRAPRLEKGTGTPEIQQECKKRQLWILDDGHFFANQK